MTATRGGALTPREPSPHLGASYGGGILSLAPELPAGLRQVTEARLRFGRTLLDVAVLRRPGRMVVKVARRFGPPLAVRIRWGGAETVERILLDGVEFPPGSLAFHAEGEHDVQFITAERQGTG